MDGSKLNNYPIDLLIKKQPGQDYSTTYYAYKIIEYFREHIPVDMPYHVQESLSKFNQKNTVKIFIDNRRKVCKRILRVFIYIL